MGYGVSLMGGALPPSGVHNHLFSPLQAGFSHLVGLEGAGDISGVAEALDTADEEIGPSAVLGNPSPTKEVLDYDVLQFGRRAFK